MKGWYQMERVGIIGAMDEEIEIFKEDMDIEKITQLAGLDFHIGKLNKRDIVLVKCGIGKVNAAICTQILIGQLGARSIINTGVAGAIREDLDVLDVIISTEVQQHDFDVTGFGYNLGEIPRMETSIFKADRILIDRAYKAGKNLLENRQVLRGKIVSGDIFVSDLKLKKKLQSKFQAYCTEMEGAAIGHTCFVNDIPFVVIRVMSDKADGSAHSNFNEFVLEAADYSKNIVINMLDKK